MIHHRHYPRELVLSALSQVYAAVMVRVIWPEEMAATAGVALALAMVHAEAEVPEVQPAVQEVRRLALCPCPF